MKPKIHHSSLSPHLPILGVLLFTLFSLLLLSSCNLFGPSPTTYDITLSPGEAYDINLGISGDEEGAAISIRPQHAIVSQTYRDTINYEIHYSYIPDSTYTGRDYVRIDKIYLSSLDPYGNAATTHNIEINFTIR